ncbi:MAG: tRNA pseudouridine(38-40) synthase TruA [Bacteroidota bacterium]|nr:tRNA pseudouridine(38-40) synthase TruA [Bacteroidota bacterium]MDP4289833.1 tRNA pseudouridine(38-40) synthase TruA [Bacteroidota bacterium]
MKPTLRYFLQIAYNGGDYNGWQIQPNGITVQEELEKALEILLRLRIGVTGCGRTDTGVHASDFYAHFDIPEEGMLLPVNQLKYKLNLLLPSSIVIHDIFKVNPDIHARFSALSRTYKYRISMAKNPFCNGFAYFYHQRLDVETMNKAAAILKEYNDFSCFSKSGTQVKTNICHITHAKWDQDGSMLVFTITADRFLRNMVRAIVGTMLDVGRSRITLEDFRKVIENKNRCNAGFSVPPQGLFLSEVKYPDFIKAE